MQGVSGVACSRPWSKTPALWPRHRRGQPPPGGRSIWVPPRAAVPTLIGNNRALCETPFPSPCLWEPAHLFHCGQKELKYRTVKKDEGGLPLPSIHASQAILGAKNLPANAGDIKKYEFNPWVRKIPWRRKRQPTPVFLPGKYHGQRSLVGYRPWGRKELDMTERLSVWMHNANGLQEAPYLRPAWVSRTRQKLQSCPATTNILQRTSPWCQGDFSANHNKRLLWINLRDQ